MKNVEVVYEITTYSLSKSYKSKISDRVKRLSRIAIRNKRLLAELGNLAGRYGFEFSVKTQSESEEVGLSWGLDRKAEEL